VDGKFAVIRGLSDRYISTTLNGGEIPSPDPYRRSASLDMFPSQMINKVVISKTFTADQPGTYTGGGINIVTKSFPEKGFAALSIGVAYNTQATMNDEFLAYENGSTDWFGMDDGGRALPGPLQAPDLKTPPIPFSSGRPTSDEYEQRLADAAKVDLLTKALGLTEFAPSKDSPPFNHNVSISMGDTTHLLGKPLGVFAAMTYRRDFSFYSDGISRRYVSSPAGFEIRKDYQDTKAVEEVNWASMVNIAYQLSDNHEIGFNFLYNQNSEDLARTQSGTTTDDAGVLFHLNRLHYTERNLQTYQLRGAHEFPELGFAKLDWLGAISQTSQDEPNTRFFNYAQDGTNFTIGKASAPDPKNPTRYFRTLDEQNENLRIDLTIPFKQWTYDDAAFKIGMLDSSSSRTFLDREVFYQGDAPFTGDPNSYLDRENLGYTARTNRSGSILYTWNRYIQTRDSAYEGVFDTAAGFTMLDIPLWSKMRLVGGARIETTDIMVNSRSYLANSVTGKSTNSSILDQADLLPAMGLIYALTTNMNLRLSYGQTIARPSFRELAGYRSYDPSLDELLDGNPLLKMSSIENYDIRWEWFPRPGEIVGVSLFYKDLQNAIERRFVTIDGEIITFANRETANVAGIEFEVRKSLDFLDPLLREFTIGGNLSLIQSEVELTREELVAKQPRVPGTSSTRPLYDQSPYILNLDISYDNHSSGTSASFIFNMAGPRITIASLNTEDIYEQSTPVLDFVLSQKIGRNMTLKLTAKNLIDPIIERTYGEEGKLTYSSYKRGMTFGMALSYEF
jgi:TonB-dependent receptor